jgi:hypothetical protein
VPSKATQVGCLGLKDQAQSGPFCNSGFTITILETKVLDTGTPRQFRCQPVFKVENNSGKLNQNVNFYFKAVRNGVNMSDILYPPALSMRSGQVINIDSKTMYSDGVEKCKGVEYLFEQTIIS